jgi:hypothetical protein
MALAVAGTHALTLRVAGVPSSGADDRLNRSGRLAVSDSVGGSARRVAVSASHPVIV